MTAMEAEWDRYAEPSSHVLDGPPPECERRWREYIAEPKPMPRTELSVQVERILDRLGLGVGVNMNNEGGE